MLVELSATWRLFSCFFFLSFDSRLSLLSNKGFVKRFLAEDLLTDASWAKFHLVAGERACFICEDVVEHSQVLNNTHIFYLGPLVSNLIEHLRVFWNEICDDKLDHFSRNKERDWDECAQKLKIANKCKKAFEDRWVTRLVVKVDWCLVVPEASQNGKRKRQNKLYHKNLDCEQVHHVFNAALLMASLLWIHHDTSFTARVDHSAEDPLGVLKYSALKEQLLWVKWKIFLFSDVEMLSDRMMILILLANL